VLKTVVMGEEMVIERWMGIFGLIEEENRIGIGILETEKINLGLRGGWGAGICCVTLLTAFSKSEVPHGNKVLIQICKRGSEE
jgi:hypothetical protein